MGHVVVVGKKFEISTPAPVSVPSHPFT
jgi:hypothetical protein